MSYQAGDVGFAHSHGFMARAIRLGEWIHFRRGDGWNHTFILGAQNAAGQWTVIQAEARGVTNFRTLDQVAPGGYYEIRRPPAPFNTELALAWLNNEVGTRYGWLTIASIIVDLVTPAKFPRFRGAWTWICSALGGEYARVGGWMQRYGDIYAVLPAEFALDTSDWEVITEEEQHVN